MPHFAPGVATHAHSVHPYLHPPLRLRNILITQHPKVNCKISHLRQCSVREVHTSSVIQELTDAESNPCVDDGTAHATSVSSTAKDESSSAPNYTATEDALLPDDSSSTASSTILQQVASTALLISPFFFWGTSMVAMKEVLPHATPLLISTLRLVPAGVVLVGWAAANGRQQPQTLTAWAWITAFALVDAAAFQGFLAEGLQRTAAGLGSVIIDSQPLSVAVLAAILFGEKLRPAGFAGLFIGVLGLLMLELPPQDLGPLLQVFGTSGAQEALGDMSNAAAHAIATDATSMTAAGVQSVITDGGDWSIWDSGEWWMLLAAQSMAVGTVMVRGVAKHCDPFIATGWHMILGGLMLLGFIVATDAPSIGSIAQFQLEDYLAMAYVSLLGGAASYGVFFDNATRGNLTALSSLTFLTPMFAAAGGFLVLHETLTPLQLTGAAVTLSAVYLINK